MFCDSYYRPNNESSPFLMFSFCFLVIKLFCYYSSNVFYKKTDWSYCLWKPPWWRVDCFDVFWSLLCSEQWIVTLLWCSNPVLSQYSSFVTIVAPYSIKNYQLKQVLRKATMVKSGVLYCLLTLMDSWTMDHRPFFMFLFWFVKMSIFCYHRSSVFYNKIPT